MHRGGGPTLPQQDCGLSCAGAVLCLQWQAEKEPVTTLHLPFRWEESFFYTFLESIVVHQLIVVFYLRGKKSH